MSDTPIRVGIVGAGNNTRNRHIPGLQALEDVEIVSVCNRSRASSERVANEFGIPTVYEDWRALVDAPEINAVVIGTWPYMHHRVTLAALAADTHVMVEARMAMNLNEALSMRDAARAKPHLVAQIVPSPFSFHVDETIKQLIADGYLGEILAINVNQNGNDFLDRDGSLSWRRNADFSGYNIMSMGIWYEALMRWVGEASRVMALGKVFVKMRPAENGRLRPVRIPEHLDIIADMACGAQAHFQFSSVTGLGASREVILYGSAGTLRFDGDKLFGGRRGDSGLAEIAIPPEQAGRWRVEEEFVNAIRGQEEIILTDFETGVKYMAFTEAVQRSLLDGQAVALSALGSSK